MPRVMTAMTEKLTRLLEEKSAEIEAGLAEVKRLYDVGGLSDEVLRKMLAFVHAYIEVFEDTEADVLLSECWTCMPQAFGATPSVELHQ